MTGLNGQIMPPPVITTGKSTVLKSANKANEQIKAPDFESLVQAAVSGLYPQVMSAVESMGRETTSRNLSDTGLNILKLNENPKLPQAEKDVNRATAQACFGYAKVLMLPEQK